MRLFVGLIPAEPVQAALLERQRSLREVITRQGVRFTAPEKIHLTLAFLGDDADKNVTLSKLGALTGPGFRAEIGGFTGFPDPSRPRVVASEVSGDGLAELHAEVGQILGLDPEDWTPHVTLARVSPGSRVVGSLVRAIPEPEPVDWPVGEVAVIHSTPSGGYELLARFPLT